jgi:hypothetical protein
MNKMILGMMFSFLLAGSIAGADENILTITGINSIEAGKPKNGKVEVTVKFTLDCIDKFVKIVATPLENEITPGSVAMAVGVLVDHPEVDPNSVRCLSHEERTETFTLPEAVEGYDFRPIKR